MITYLDTRGNSYILKNHRSSAYTSCSRNGGRRMDYCLEFLGVNTCFGYYGVFLPEIRGGSNAIHKAAVLKLARVTKWSQYFYSVQRLTPNRFIIVKKTNAFVNTSGIL